MQWLPAIRHENAGWLLPLAPETAHFLAGLICDTSDQQGPLADPDWAAVAMAERLHQDPALAIFSLLEVVARHSETSAKRFELETHASWFCDVVVDLFRDRDRQLLTHQRSVEIAGSKPTILEHHGWSKLAQTTLNLPLDRWMQTASDWLCKTGPKPSEDWRKTWPQFEPFNAIEPCDEIEPSESSELETPCEGTEWREDSTATASMTTLNYGGSSLDLYRLARNQTELRQLRERFTTRLQIEKMASLKQLAYGLSHEINNPLAAIRTRAEQLMADEPRPEYRQKLDRIVDSAMRAHEMIADMMFFAKPPQPQRESLSAWSLTASIADEFLTDASARAITISCTPQPPRRSSALQFQGDIHQIGEALRALIRNAIEAIGNRGTIHIEVKRSGQRVIWTVIDNGPGLTAEARRHAFDPYFSGREAGRGLGLGLCRVYRVARAHGGGAVIEGTEVGCRVRMWVQSKTEFKV